MKSEESKESKDIVEEAKKSEHRPLLWIIISIILLIIVIILAVLLFQEKKSSSAQKKESQKKQQELQSKVQSAEKELATTKKDQQQSKPVPSTNTTVTFPASMKANLEAVLSSGNTQPIETYVTNPVTAVLAATEAYGQITPAQAAAIDYTSDAQQPWNCSLPAATLTAWQNGSYKQYFSPTATLACKSSNNKVIAFTVNSSGKITTIFMSASSDLL